MILIFHGFEFPIEKVVFHFEVLPLAVFSIENDYNSKIFQ
jgi:hypothetical protein